MNKRPINSSLCNSAVDWLNSLERAICEWLADILLSVDVSSGLVKHMSRSKQKKSL